ncbi:MAG: Zn-ribbon domain-containing OB-fold protein [Lautropia sp.]
MDYRDLEYTVAEYWRGIESDRLLIRRCRTCGTTFHPRRLGCTECGTESLEWIPARGSGEVYSFSILDHYTPLPELKASLPYCLGIVQLDEGLHVFTRLIADDLRDIRIGMRVQVRFDDLGTGRKLPIFEPSPPDDRGRGTNGS